MRMMMYAEDKKRVCVFGERGRQRQYIHPIAMATAKENYEWREPSTAYGASHCASECVCCSTNLTEILNEIDGHEIERDRKMNIKRTRTRLKCFHNSSSLNTAEAKRKPKRGGTVGKRGKNGQKIPSPKYCAIFEQTSERRNKKSLICCCRRRHTPHLFWNNNRASVKLLRQHGKRQKKTVMKMCGSCSLFVVCIWASVLSFDLFGLAY